MGIKKEKIITLKAFPFSEGHLIVRGLSSLGGKITFKAFGALKSKKRFSGGVLEPCSLIEAEYSPSRSGGLAALRSARLLRDFHGLRSDYERITLGLYFAGLTDSVIQESQEDLPELFHLLGNALQEAEETALLPALKLCFQVKFLFLQGALPSPHRFKAILTRSLKDHRSFDTAPFQEDGSLQAERQLARYLDAP